MARFQHLPLYQATYSLCLNSHRLKLKMSKNLKHDAGEAFVNNCLKCLKIIVITNQLQEKKKHLDMLHFEFEMLWASSRLLLDMQGITSEEFKVLSEALTDIGKQVQAWRRWEVQNMKNRTGEVSIR